VITNEEACGISRERILLWNKKNGTDVSTEQSNAVDAAVQYACCIYQNLHFKGEANTNYTIFLLLDLKDSSREKYSTHH
jgi:hypothetical protein